jgi:hypothetical protein
MTATRPASSVRAPSPPCSCRHRRAAHLDQAAQARRDHEEAAFGHRHAPSAVHELRARILRRAFDELDRREPGVAGIVRPRLQPDIEPLAREISES